MKNLLVSFSGGETSAYMAQWLWNNKRDQYNMVFVFANTGQEEYETIHFIQRCSEHFGFPVHYIEALVHHGERKANTYKELQPTELSMEGEPFEEVIKKHGIPNVAQPFCSRELKTNPVRAFGRKIFQGEPYSLAIGIRSDEFDRISARAKENKIVYPLITDRPMTKPKINFWWSQQPFRLQLKGYQGNCRTCWKKSDKKLYQIAKENPTALLFMHKMEARYGHFTPESRLKLMEARGESPKYPITFFRGNRSACDIQEEAKRFTGIVKDDHQEVESCDLFSGCGEDY